MHMTHGANGSPQRSYKIHNEKGLLQVQSMEFADDADFSFTMRFEGERKPIQAFQSKFKELDDVVAALIAEGQAPNPQVTDVVEHKRAERKRGR